MSNRVIIILFLFFSPMFVFSQTNDSLKTTTISGKVKDNKGKPVNAANLVIQGTIDGATTDETGSFEFETEKTGKKNLIITSIDYAEKTIEINIIPGQNLNLNIVLSPEVRTDEIVVTASTFTSGINSQVTLTPLEITRIPGADADLYRAITTFPGSNQVDEGSRIAVRGGDPNEVLTILDQASLYNPFIFDNVYNTSSYSTVNPWGLKGINFSSGGFSAKYGNVLSAILDLQSYDIPRGNGMFAILGLANAGLSGVFTNSENTFGVTFSTSQTFLKPFMEINGDNTDYSPIPTATTLGGTIAYKMSKKSLLKYYINYNYDKLGIRNESPTYNGYFESKSQSIFNNLKFSTAPTNLSLLDVSLSYSSYFTGIKYGALDNNSKAFYAKFRTDFSIPLTSDIDFSTGLEYEYSRYKTEGVFPLYFYNIRPEADKFNIEGDKNSGRAGLYTEAKFKISRDFNAIAGLRSDFFSNPDKNNITLDPRLSLVYRLSEYSFLRGATGIYHQNPNLSNFFGYNNFDLKPEQAIHYILGYEYNREGDYIFRVEGYYKDYSKLIANSYYNNSFTSDGNGFAKGVDVFLKVRLKPKFNGWISYAYTDSKRKEFGSGQLVSANYDITHSLSVVGTYNIFGNFTVGASYKFSTGKPYTPVAGGIYDPAQNAYIPIYAQTNSDRFPSYHRIDINAQDYFTLFNRFIVVFFALNNLFNQDNLYTYSYNFDYSKKIAIRSTNIRTVYFGFGMQL
jgi:vitamin B12 transporter